MLGRVPNTGELVMPKTRYIVLYACAAQESRSPACITAPAAGPTAYSIATQGHCDRFSGLERSGEEVAKPR